MVGAVLVRHGEVVGEGYHRRVGGPHAEIEALRQAGERARDSTLYVTLEPCSHHGRTPPCSEAVIAAGIRRVVACHRDPNPLVGGGGFARLRQAGVQVDDGFLVPQAVRLNWRFLAALRYGRPAVSLKWAMSLDGRIATVNGESQWISSPQGRRWGLNQREEHDGILVGSGTALADDPRLDRRLGKAEGPNLRVVMDRRLRIGVSARMLDIPGEVVVYTEEEPGLASRRLSDRGASVVHLPAVTPQTVLADLQARGTQSLLVEGGAEVAAAFVTAGTFERVGVDCAPLLIGGQSALGPLAGVGSSPLSAAPRLRDLRVQRRGDDVILIGFREQCLQDLYASVAG